jgi:hypothetical protein
MPAPDKALELFHHPVKSGLRNYPSQPALRRSYALRKRLMARVFQ